MTKHRYSPEEVAGRLGTLHAWMEAAQCTGQASAVLHYQQGRLMVVEFVIKTTERWREGKEEEVAKASDDETGYKTGYKSKKEKPGTEEPCGFTGNLACY